MSTSSEEEEKGEEEEVQIIIDPDNQPSILSLGQNDAIIPTNTESVTRNTESIPRKSIRSLGGMLTNFLHKPEQSLRPATDASPEVPLIHPPPLLKAATLGYMKTVQRRGNTYMIRDSIPSDDDPVESDGVDHMITDLYNETMQMSSSANSRAGIFKYLYVLAAIFITIAGAIVGSLTIQGFSNAESQYAAGILGFGIAAVQALVSTFSIQNRSVLLKEVSNRLRKVARGLKNLQNSESKPRDKMKRLEEYYAEVDELDLNMFDNTITSVSAPKVSSNDTKSSDLSSRSDPLYEDQHPTPEESSPKNNGESNVIARRFIKLLQHRKSDPESTPRTQSTPQ